VRALFFAVALEEYIASALGVDRFLGRLYRPTTPVVGGVISITEDTPDITRAFLARTLAHGVVTSTFHTLRLEVEKNFGVPVSLTIGILRDISGVPGRFRPNVALLQEFNFKDVLCCLRLARGR
jgi:hypothetical protein